MRKGISFSPKGGSRATGGGGIDGNANGMGALTPSSGKGLFARRGGWRGGAAVFPSRPACSVRTGAEIFEASKESLFPNGDPSGTPDSDLPQPGRMCVRMSVGSFSMSKESLIRATGTPPATGTPKAGLGIVRNTSRNFPAKNNETTI